jgi:hypothetical protein
MTRGTSFAIHHHPVLEPDECLGLLEALPKTTRSRAGPRHLFWRPVVSALAKDPRLTRIAYGFLGRAPLELPTPPDGLAS